MLNLLDKKLVKKLAWMLVFKLFVLTALWWFFVRDQRVVVDAGQVAEQFLPPAPVKPLNSKEEGLRK